MEESDPAHVDRTLVAFKKVFTGAGAFMSIIMISTDENIAKRLATLAI